MAALQARLVDHAATMVRPGGLLVYATCSLEPAEGEAQIDRFLGSHSDFAIDPVLPDELPEGIAPHPRGWLRTLPGMLAEQGGCAGFFIARMMRVGRSEEHTSVLPSTIRTQYAVSCLQPQKPRQLNQ